MEPGTQSFMPHEMPSSAQALNNQRRGVGDLMALLSIVLVVASIALAAGIFLYGGYLHSSAASKTDQLERAKAAFEPSLINELTRLDDRMRAASEVLGTHIAPTTFFNMLEQTTIQTIAFSSLSFEASDPQNMKIEMDGVAASVNAIALQADLFSRGGMITSPIFSNIDRELDGVHFNLSAQVNPAAISYSQVAAGVAAPPLPQPQEENLSPFGGTAIPAEQATSSEESSVPEE